MTNSTTKTQDPKSIIAFIQEDSFKKQLQMALPKHITPDRMLRVMLTEFRLNPMLTQCELKSILGCLIQCAQLGLEPGNNLGHAYLIPFNNRKKGTKDCNLIIGYKGLMDLARRSGELLSISAQPIFENDEFDFEYGLNQRLRHIPTKADRGSFIGAYAIAHLKDNAVQFEVMWKNEIDKIRNSSQSASSSYSPWITHYEEMAKKTVIRRICKYLPSSVELQKAIHLDEISDIGKQDISDFVDVPEIDIPEIEEIKEDN